MKVIIREEINCNYDNLKKFLPSQFLSLVNKRFFNQTVTLICFPVNKTVTSNCLKKALKKIKNTNITALFFARCFTLESIKIIKECGGESFVLSEYPWTDEKYNQIH